MRAWFGQEARVALSDLLIPGETLQVRVLAQVDPAFLLLQVKGEELIARNLVGLKPGDLAEVQVEPPAKDGGKLSCA